MAAPLRLAVGCARGLDAMVRQAAPPASMRVFHVASYGNGRGAFAARSVACVRFAQSHGIVAFSGSRSLAASHAPLVGSVVGSVVAAAPRPGLVAFPTAAAPAALAPSASAAACFAGYGSGTWATAAYAVGLGLPLVLFPCGEAQLPGTWGAWQPCAGAWRGGYLLKPGAVQKSLF